jgi:diguanylate cyclase (GGDEF)-like protein
MEQRPPIRSTQVFVLGSERLVALAHAAAAIADLPAIAIRTARDSSDSAGNEAEPVDAVPIDAVLSDRTVSSTELRSLLSPRRRHVGRVLVGAVDVPEAPQAELIALPADATAREVRLACVLVADADRWRRRLERRARKERRMRRLSFSDPLTGVGNLRAWKAKLAAGSRRVREEEAAVTVAMFDVDHFKTINDTHGHAAGDDVLRSIAALLTASVREGDFVARLGGDEFGLILGNSTAEQAGRIVERVRQEVSTVVAAGEENIFLSVSAGWCSIGPNDATDEVVERADAALRMAKQLGRGQTQASPTPTKRDGGERTA